MLAEHRDHPIPNQAWEFFLTERSVTKEVVGYDAVWESSCARM